MDESELLQKAREIVADWHAGNRYVSAMDAMCRLVFEFQSAGLIEADREDEPAN